MKIFLNDAAERGWRGVVLNRRGHTDQLKTSQFDIMGNVADTKVQIDIIAERYPGVFIGLAGVSAGSGLMVSFMGQMGDNTPVNAACSLCPAYDIDQAFRRIAIAHPLVDKFFVKDNSNYFFTGANGDILKAANPE